MGILKIGMIVEKTVATTHGYLEIDTEDYEELRGLSEEDAKNYLKENLYDFELNDKYSYDDIYDQLYFEGQELNSKTPTIIK